MPGHNPDQGTAFGGRVLCQNCHHENPDDVAYCVHCGESLNFSTTIIIPNRSDILSRGGHMTELAKVHRNSIVLYIMGHDQPLVIKGHGQTLLGRHSPGHPPPNLDLGKYDGQILGVSRQHAIIRSTDKGCTIEDLGSSNGTFVNESRLGPNQISQLRNGDLIRLGQLMIYIYFQAKDKRQTMDQHDIFVQILAALPQGTDNLNIANRVIPYLREIARLQSIIDKLIGREATKLQIKTINRMETIENHVQVMMVGHSEAVEFIHDVLNPWRDQHTAKLRQAKASQTQSTDILTIPQHVRSELFALAQILIQQFAKTDEAKDDPKPYIRDVAGPMYELAISEMQVQNVEVD